MHMHAGVPLYRYSHTHVNTHAWRHTIRDIHDPPPKKKPRGFLWCGFSDGVIPQISCELIFFPRCQRENTRLPALWKTSNGPWWLDKGTSEEVLPCTLLWRKGGWGVGSGPQVRSERSWGWVFSWKQRSACQMPPSAFIFWDPETVFWDMVGTPWIMLN